MSGKLYTIQLNEEERERLVTLVTVMIRSFPLSEVLSMDINLRTKLLYAKEAICQV